MKKPRGPVGDAFNWWKPFAQERGAVPLYVVQAGQVYCVTPEIGTKRAFGFDFTGRSVKDIGGVWLGEAKPPGRGK